MTGHAPLPDEEIGRFVAASGVWRREGDALVAAFVFPGFRAALSFIVAVGLEAEALDHHPEIRNVWNKVWLRLATHDAGNRVTGLDVALARVVEALWVRFGP